MLHVTRHTSHALSLPPPNANYLSHIFNSDAESSRLVVTGFDCDEHACGRVLQEGGGGGGGDVRGGVGGGVGVQEEE